jgi:hypothetical protein
MAVNSRGRRSLDGFSEGPRRWWLLVRCEFRPLFHGFVLCSVAIGLSLGSFWRDRTTWATAGPAGAGKMLPVGNGDAPVKFGLVCMDTRRVRIEIESSVISTLTEVSLLKRKQSADVWYCNVHYSTRDFRTTLALSRTVLCAVQLCCGMLTRWF